MTARETRRDRLYDFAVDHPRWTVNDVMRHFEWSHHTANEAIHDLRLFLGETDDITLTATPNGSRERWTYELVGTLDAVKPWAGNRVVDTESRLRTFRAVMAPLARSLDPRSSDGRRARVMHRHLDFLVEELNDLGT